MSDMVLMGKKRKKKRPFFQTVSDLYKGNVIDLREHTQTNSSTDRPMSRKVHYHKSNAFCQACANAQPKAQNIKPLRHQIIKTVGFYYQIVEGLLTSIRTEFVKSIRTGRNFSSKLKIFAIYILRYLQILSPWRMQRYFDLIVQGMIIEADVKFSIGALYDFFVFSPSWEEELGDVFKLKKGMNFLDVGAHIGKYAVRVANMVGNEGNVVAVEPNKDNFEVLVRNIELNQLQNCIPLNLAAYHTNRDVSLFLGPSSAEHTIKEDLGKGSYKVKARALDDVLKEIGIEKVDLVKLDVEGAELEVLKGLERTLEKGNPVLVVEILKKDEHKVIDYLHNLAYREKLLNVSGRGHQMHYCFRKEARALGDVLFNHQEKLIHPQILLTSGIRLTRRF
jgi:FkbM family methyltransferase